MNRILAPLLLLALIWAVQHSTRAEEVPALVTAWLDYNDADAALPEAENCSVERDTHAARGNGCLAIKLPEPMKKVARLTFKLPRGWPVTKMRALQCYVRTTPEPEPVVRRWFAEDAAGNALFQRRFEFDQGAAWTLMEFPLSLWRWGDVAGDWEDVRTLSLAIESRVGKVKLDELCWPNGQPDKDNATATPELYEEIAFGTHKVHVVERDGFRLAGDTLGTVPAEDLDRLFKRFGPIPKWLTRVFGSAAHTPGADSPISVLIFATREDYIEFAKRLGTAWRVAIAPPAAGGYAIQDIATSYVDEKLGVDRPVFFHETVHATAARYLRLIPGNPAHSWLQEGLANYLQLCLFPDSLALDTYGRLFKEGIGEKTFFRPLSELLTGKIELKNYAQLAALTAWLVDKHSDWLAKFARSIAAGGELADALALCETGFDAMQKEWLAWGADTFKPDAERKIHFEVPTEWVDANAEDK